MSEITTGFGFDNTVNSEAAPVSKYLEPGIHENCTLTKVDTNHDNGGYIEFEFTSERGEAVSKRYYNPASGPYASDANIKKFNRLMKNIATKYLGDDFVFPPVKSFQEFVDQFKNLLAGKTANVKVRVKVVLNNQDYATLPGYAPIVESMAVPKDQSKLELNPKYDRVEKQKASAENESSDDSTPW